MAGVITLGPHTFRTRADVERHIRGIFSRYAITTLTEPLCGDDRTFAEALIAMHPRAADVIDCGLSEVRVQRVPFNETQKRFLVIRTDRSWRDFAWRKCLYPRSQLQQVRAICREIIEPQIADFRRRFWTAHRTGAICPILRVFLTPQMGHVDHHDPVFVDLVDGWLRADLLDVDDIEITYCRGYQERNRFTDPGHEASWSEYHRINAHLRVVSARANLSTLRRSA